MNRQEVIEKINEVLQEDVTSNFEEAEETNAINGNPDFFVSNSNNLTVRVIPRLSEDGLEVTYTIDEEPFS